MPAGCFQRDAESDGSDVCWLQSIERSVSGLEKHVQRIQQAVSSNEELMKDSNTVTNSDVIVTNRWKWTMNRVE